MFFYLKQRWSTAGGYREVLVLALPLIVTTSTNGLQSFIDRLMLATFSSDALAATVPASFVCVTLTALFMGVASYISVLVAQQQSAGRAQIIGEIVWQGIYLVGLSLVLVLPLYVFFPALFAWIGHDPTLQIMEVAYARVLTLAIPIIIIFTSLSGFFIGLGKASLVMWVNALITLINLGLDYLLIFGAKGMGFLLPGVDSIDLPPLGVSGAAWATFVAYGVGAVLLLWLFLRAPYQTRFNTRRGWRFKRPLFKTLLYFGLPIGAQIQLESLAWTVFVLMIGNLGVAELTAHSIAMNIFMLAVMPMAGISVAVSVLVARRIGENNTHLVKRVTGSAMHLAIVLFAGIGFTLAIHPDFLIELFAKGMNEPMRQMILAPLRDLLRMVVFYSLFQTVAMILAGALKGAGDTHFVAWSGIAVVWLVLVLPSALMSQVASGSLHFSWLCLVASALVSCLVYSLRYRRKRWRAINLADERPAETHPPAFETVD